ncbi:MAG: Rab family GTPase [Candidatus Thorarchaeota archaeon]
MAVPVYKVLLVGEPNVGKSSIIRWMLLGEFDEKYCATVGVDLSAIAINVDPITPVILTTIDLGGQDDFGALRSQYYRGARSAILVYDVTKRASFECLREWYDGICKNVARDLETFPGFVFANKCDLQEVRDVDSSEGRIFAESIGWPFYEGSAKTGDMIREVFHRIAKQLYTTHLSR